MQKDKKKGRNKVGGLIYVAALFVAFYRALKPCEMSDFNQTPVLN